MNKEDITPTITNCEQEPIHIIGQSQAHGVIVVCDPKTFKITQCSENVEEILGLSLASVLDSDLSALLSLEVVAKLEKKLAEHRILLPVEEIINGNKYTIIPHTSDSNLVLDIEPAGQFLHPALLQNQLTAILSEMEGALSIPEMCELAVMQVKELFEYDRVMMYKFDEEWNGEVIAEVKEDNLESWLGLNYPARDIPKQARAIFLKQGVRIISDVNFKPSAIVPAISPITNQPLDISRSELRSVSPIHIEYLTNMKVGASLTAAIVLEGELWGLLACHHYSPKFINYHQRQTCKFLTQVFSNSLSVKTSKTFLDKFTASEYVRKKLVLQLESISSIREALVKFSPKFTDLIDCTGGAVIQDGKIDLLGITPSKSELHDLYVTLLIGKEELFSTKNLSEHFHPSSSYSKLASGIISVRINDDLNTMLLWFRPEVSETVSWGGNPEKEGYIKDGVEYLSPRKSFEKWTQQNSGIARRWEDYDLEAIEALKESISHIVIKKQKDKIFNLNQELLSANNELETFSYSISHDLRAPLRGIDGYARIIRDHHMQDLDEYSKKAIRTIVKSAEDMNGLIEDILSYSSVGKTHLKLELISVEKIAQDVLLKHNVANQFPNTSFKIALDMPKIQGDRRMISQLLNNLIGNALKYSSKSESPGVEIGYQNRGSTIVYYVKDNGIGIDSNLSYKIFDVFSRIAGDDYEGSGIGLAIAKKVIDLHHGKLWLESELGKGSTFFFSISNLEK